MTTSTLAQSYEPSEPSESSSLIIERFLRDRESIWQQIRQEYQLNHLIRTMLRHSVVALACYGGVIGLSHSIPQALSSAIKAPLLFLLTMAICLPTLYLFNLLYGGVMSARQAVALVLSAITVTSGLTLAFAPMTLFFLFTVHSYGFFVLLNVLLLSLTGVIGMGFLFRGMQTINRPEPAAPVPATDQPQAEQQAEQQAKQQAKQQAEQQAKQQKWATTKKSPSQFTRLLYLWLMLYGFVGTQLAWTLRPFFGSPGEPFQLFRTLEGNFYHAVLRLFLG